MSLTESGYPEQVAPLGDGNVSPSSSQSENDNLQSTVVQLIQPDPFIPLDPELYFGYVVDFSDKPPITSWLDPTPIKSELLPVAKFDPSMLPRILTDYVMSESFGMPCNPDFIAVSLLTAIGSVMGARVAVMPKANDFWSIIANLWGGCLAPPSNYKSPAMASGMKPLERLMEQARKRHIQELKEYKVKLMLHEALENGLKAQLKQAGKTSDAENTAVIIDQIQSHQKAAPEEPKLKRYKCNDGTPQAIADLEVQNPNGILLLNDELTSFFSKLDKDGGKADSAFFLEGWSGQSPYEIDRIGRGYSMIENHCLTIFGGIQPDLLVKYLASFIKENGNNGMFQRFQLLVYPDPVSWEYRDLKSNLEARNRVYDLFKMIDALTEQDLVNIGASPADSQSKRPYFRFTEDAQLFYIQWTTKLHQQTIKQEEHAILIQHFTKYDKLMPALALLFHVIDCLESGLSGSVSLQSVQYAAKWCDYLETHARRIYHLVLDSKTIAAATLAQKITQLSRKHSHKSFETQHNWVKDGFTARHVQQKGWTGLTELSAIHDALEMLIDEHWLKCTDVYTTARGGRPSKLFWINPKIII